MPRQNKFDILKENYKLPDSILNMVGSRLSLADSRVVLTAMEESIKLESTKPTLIDKGNTVGDWTASLPDFTDDIRPLDALSFEIIEQMMKSAPVIFAVEMKRSAIVSIFRNERSWNIQCPDEELKEIVTANLRQILPKMSLDFSYSSLVYGTSFQELVWEYRNKYELGITDSKYQGNKKFLVAKIPNSVDPTTVSKIRRTKDGSFNGFVQGGIYHGRKYLTPNLAEEIIVDRDSALVIPYNEKYRNLWGESMLKSIYPIWFWYEVVLRSMVRFMERSGTPVTVVRAPNRSTVINPVTREKVDGMTWGMEVASSVSRSSAAVIPSDRDDQGNPLWDIEYLSSAERGQPFLDILELLTQMILRAGLNADRALSQSSGGVGSYNIGEIHKEATALHNEMILIQWLHYLNTYFLPHYSLYNKGVNGPPIWLETQGLDPTDRENLNMMLTLAQSTDSFKTFSFRIDWESLFGTNNIPLLDEADAQAKEEDFTEKQREKEEMFQQSKAKAFGTVNTPKGQATDIKAKENDSKD